MMRRLLVAFALAGLLPFGALGCGGDATSTAADVTTDNRPAEIREADDAMIKAMQKVNSRKPGRRRESACHRDDFPKNPVVRPDFCRADSHFSGHDSR